MVPYREREKTLFPVVPYDLLAMIKPFLHSIVGLFVFLTFGGSFAAQPSDRGRRCTLVFVNRPEFASNTRLYDPVQPEQLTGEQECKSFQEGFVDVTFCVGQTILVTPTNVYEQDSLS